jgi:hypothetical protein
VLVFRGVLSIWPGLDEGAALLWFRPPLPKAETDAVALLLLFTVVIRSLLRNSKVIGRIGG